MGPRSDERGTQAVGEGMAENIELQWGRALMNAELPQCVINCTVNDVLPASMGPRSDERGTGSFPLKPPSGRLLQWGRALMNAELMEPRKTKENAYELQWGRALMNAELLEWTSY